MIDFLKGHPCGYSERELDRIDEIAKETFLNGSEIASDVEIETDLSLELSINEAILKGIKRENYSSDKEYLDALEAVRSNI